MYSIQHFKKKYWGKKTKQAEQRQKPWTKTMLRQPTLKEPLCMTRLLTSHLLASDLLKYHLLFYLASCLFTPYLSTFCIDTNPLHKTSQACVLQIYQHPYACYLHTCTWQACLFKSSELNALIALKTIMTTSPAHKLQWFRSQYLILISKGQIWGALQLENCWLQLRQLYRSENRNCFI